MAKKTARVVKDSKKFHFRLSDKKIFIILLAVFVMLNILNFDPKLFLGGDNAHYLTLAKSLLSGSGYKDIFAPFAPAHTQYPPGFPLLLVPGIVIFGNNFPLIKLFILLLSIGSFYLFYKLVKSRFTGSYWILPILLFTFSPLIVMYSHYLLSEIPFIFFSFLALYFFERFSKLKKETTIFFIMMVSAFIFTYYIRTAGLSIIIAGLLFLIYKKQYKEFLIFIIITGIFIYLWQSRSAKFGGGGYLQQFFTRNPYDLEAGKISFGEYLGRFFGNLKLYTLLVFPQILFPTIKSSSGLGILGFIMSALSLTGLVSRLRHISIWEIYTVLFLGITFSWPEVWTGDRFLLPILPFLFYYLFVGIKVIAKKSNILPTIVTGAIVIFSVVHFSRNTPENLTNFSAFLKGDKMAGYPADWQHYFQTLDWIKNNTEAEAVIASRKPQFTYLFSERKSFTAPFTTDEDKVLESLKSNNARYILFDRFYWTGTTTKYLGPIVQKYPDKFQIIYKTSPPEMYVLKIL